MTYNGYAIHGFYSTIDDLKDLENTLNYINNGRRASVSIAQWYLALEAYINSIIKITLLLDDIDPEPIIQQEIQQRLSFLITKLGYDNFPVKKSGLYGRINEFRKFRNEIFHDRHVGKMIIFKNTHFSVIPQQCNQVDVMQAALLFIEVANLFRFSIPGLDLMPNISIGDSTKLHFDKLDILYESILRPIFQQVLAKWSLQTRLNLSISDLTSLKASATFKKGEVVIVSVVEQDKRYKVQPGMVPTNIGSTIYTKCLEGYHLPEGHYSGLNFILDWPDLYKSMFPMRR
ncbi:hypothetical protein ACRQ5D_34450 [Mucilaginibacter sp. P25]|uniref:hypothetical protein n=1 Tax=Mucilaginibacter sp. P25 TaxID=3423945 RepID=UPI003D7A070D